MATSISGVPCVDPRSLAASCAERGIPTPWMDKAGLFRLPAGRKWGVGHVLLRLSDLISLALTADHDLTFSGEDRNHVVTFTPVTILDRQCVTPGYEFDSAAVYLCEVVDRRFHLARIPVNKAYNLRSADGTTRLSSSLNVGVAWTWQEIVQDLATTLGIGTLTLPFTPDATPENLNFFAAFAWDALCDVLDRIGCVIVLNPVANTFALERLGVDQDAALTALEASRLYKRKTWDGYCDDYARGDLPQYARVLFRRRPEPKDGSSPYYVVDVTLTATTGVVTGTYVQLHDDLTALGATGAPTNAAALSTRATERGTDWRRKRVYYERNLIRVYRDFQPEAVSLLGSAVSVVIFDDSGLSLADGAMQTAARGESDGAMEAWKPLAGSEPVGAETVAPPATPTQNTVPTFNANGDLQSVPQYVIEGTDTVTQYTVPNVGDNPASVPVMQYVVENDGTASITQSVFTNGTGGANGYTSTLTPTQHVVSYSLDGETGGYTVSSNGTNIVYTYSNAIITGATITGGPTWQLIGTKTHADLTAASTTEVLTYATLAAKTAILGMFVRTKTVGSGGGVASLVLNVTISGAPVGANGNGLSADDIAARWYPDDMTTLRQVPSWTATTAVGVQFFADVNVVDLTGGEWELYGLLTTVP